MLNIAMSKKHVIIALILITALLIFNNILHGIYIKMVSTPSDIQTTTNTEQTSAQKLFDRTWKIIKKSYYDTDMNHQDWYRWKAHYQGKIKTEEDFN